MGRRRRVPRWVARTSLCAAGLLAALALVLVPGAGATDGVLVFVGNGAVPYE